MKMNAKRSIRNSKKRNWLLAGGLMKCAICGEYGFISIIGGTKRTKIRYYGCGSRNSDKARGLNIACYSPYVKADILEFRVWEEIEKVIYEPETILNRLEEKVHEEELFGYEEQIQFIDKQIDSLMKERGKFEAAYQREIYTLDEFEEKMLDIRQRYETFKKSQEKLQAKLEESHSIEDKKIILLAALKRVREAIDQAKKEGKLSNEIPFSLKRKIIILLVDVIWVDSEQGSFQIEGEIRGTFSLNDDESEDSSSGGSMGGSNFGLSSNLKSRLCASCLWCGNRWRVQGKGRCRCRAGYP
jgi:hypothetical protein